MRTLTRIIQSPVLSISLLIVFSLIHSENASAQGFKMGLSVNPNVSWLVSTDYDHTTDGTKLNFGFEFVADITISDNYSLGTGIHVFNTGGTISYLTMKDQGIVELQTVKRDYSLKYVEVPITFKMRTKEIGYSTIYGRFGLGVGLNIRAEAEEERRTSWTQKVDGTWEGPTEDVGFDAPTNPEVDNDIRILRTAMIIGAGVERSLGGSSSLIIGVTYNVGLLNSHKDVSQWVVTNGAPEESAPEDPNYLKGHDGFVELSLGILF